MSQTLTPPKPDQTPLHRPWAHSDRPVPRRVVQPLQRFMHTEVAGGLVLVAAAVVALVWANSPWASGYEALWHTEAGLRVGPFSLEHDLHFWVNDLLMAVFFFVVGLEIKRELVHGDLRDPKVAMLPVIAAVGGMVVPAAIYAAINAGGPAAGGWGIPMATDIAFAVGVLALLGRRVPVSLKVFLLTLAVADDIGAIIVIAVFYSSGVAFGWLAAAAGVIGLTVALQRLRVRSLVPYAVLAAALWLTTLASGIHPTIAGVLLGLLTPAWPFHRPDDVATVAGGVLGSIIASDDEEYDEQELIEVSRLAAEGVSPLARLERHLHPWSAYLILPLFALANAGVHIGGGGLTAALGQPVTIGVALGLVLGKPLGVLAATALAVLTRKSQLPRGATWLQIAGVGMLAGLGFTVALFVAGLSFSDPHLGDGAKVGILAASLSAALLGALLLTLGARAGTPARR